MEKNKRKQIWFIALGAVVCLAAVVLLVLMHPANSSTAPTPVVAADNGNYNTPIAVVVTPQPSFTPSPTPNSGIVTVVLSINPSIEFQIDADEMIVSVTGRNADGEALIGDIDFTGYTYENAVVMVVNRLIMNGYISAAAVDERIQLSVVSENGDLNVLDTMQAAIQTVSSQFQIKLEAVQDEETKQIELILQPQNEEQEEEAHEEEPAATAKPEANGTLVIEYDLTGYMNTPADVCYVESEGFDNGVWGTVRYSRFGYSEIDQIYFTINGERFVSHKIINDCDFLGGHLHYMTVYCILGLVQRGYIREDSPMDVTVYLKHSTREQVEAVQTFINLIFSQAGMGLRVEKTKAANVLAIVPAPKPENFVPPTYTLRQIFDPYVIKQRNLITQEQMQLVYTAYIDEELAEESLLPRYWVVVPNFVGLTEAEAVELCRLVGLDAYVDYLSLENVPIEYSGIEEGRVALQTLGAGAIFEVGNGVQLIVLDKSGRPWQRED